MAGTRRGVASWVDYPNLIATDVARGYPYIVVLDDSRRGILEVCDGRLVVDGMDLAQVPLPDAPRRPDWWDIDLANSLNTFAHAMNRGLEWYDVVDQTELVVRR